MGIIFSKFYQAAKQVNGDTAEVSNLAESASRKVDVHPLSFWNSTFCPRFTQFVFGAVAESDGELTILCLRLSFRMHFKCPVPPRFGSFLMHVNNFEKLSKLCENEQLEASRCKLVSKYSSVFGCLRIN